MKAPLLIMLTVALLMVSLPVYGQESPPATAQPWPPDLSILLEQPIKGGWSLPLRFLEPAGQLGGLTVNVDIQGALAFVTDGPRMQILDLANPASPRALGQTQALPGLVTSITVSGTIAYVTIDQTGLHTFDVSDPAAPVWLGACTVCTAAHHLALAGVVAYVAASDRGLEIVDVTEPAQPSLIGRLRTPYSALDVVVSGELAILTDLHGLRIVDVSSPSSPHLVGSLDTTGFAGGLDLAGHTAYFPDSEVGLLIVDIADPAHPREIGRYQAAEPVDVTVVGSLAYLSEWWVGMRIVDVADPAQPSEVGHFSTPAYVMSVAVRVTDTTMRCPWCSTKTTAYLADGDGGLRIADVSDPARPRELGFYNTLGFGLNAAVAGSLVYVAAGHSGLRILDASNPMRPRETGSYPGSGGCADVAVVGNTAYLATQYEGLHVLDVSNPAGPARLGSLALPGSPRSVAVQNRWVYLAAESAGLRIVDVDDPTKPVEVGSYPIPGIARAVTMRESTALVAAGPAGLLVIDVSDPQHPALVGALDTPGDSRDVAVAGSMAYVADWWGGLRMIDVADPTHPREVGHFPTRGEAAGVALGFQAPIWNGASVVLVAMEGAGLSAIDVTVPESPVEITSVDTPGGAEAVGLGGSLAAIADGAGGLTLVNLLRDRQATIITPAGGSMATDDGSMIAIFPANAFTETVSLSYKRLAVYEGSDGLLGIGQPFEFKADSVDNGQPVGLAPGKEFSLVLRYSDYELGPAVEESLHLVHQDDGLWQPEPSSQVHVSANTVTALPRWLGWWTILGETQRRYLPLTVRSQAFPPLPCQGQSTIEPLPGWRCRNVIQP